MNKSQKIYNKALSKYNNGYIDAAIKLCEESISIDIKNKASINLKGLLLYLKGDLDKSQKLWKMNYQVNGDEIAEKYLESSKKDSNKIEYYKEALVLVEKFKIDEALVLLEKCAESDFNYINVNNYSALCYMKKGQYAKALEKINNVLKIDVKNTEAKENIKLLESINVIDKKNNIRKICYISFAGILIACGIFFIFNKSGVSFTKFFNTGIMKAQNINHADNKNVKSVSRKTDKNIKKTFPLADMENYIKNKDYDSMYIQVMNWRNYKLDSNEANLISEAYKLLTTEGCVYFYNLGCNYLKNEDYNNAKSYLKKSYEFGTGNELYPHIIYMLGTSFDLSGDSKGSLKYYEEYDDNFSDGSYEETVLYRLAVIYKESNITKSKNYAKKLVDTYPESIYNNSQINNLIN
ncbi:tetratricopeptide repeat protein [Clostridium sp.]|uniref:tetratricopeptide repeat protein n=1 Tax=Clostridium sp. TaxID=1506 RepID=UPI002FDD3953